MTNIHDLKLTVAALMLAVPATYGALPYADGDLILGLRATSGLGASYSYEVNIGPASSFTSATTIPLNKADLDALFGPGWDSRADLYWSVSGTRFATDGTVPSRTLYASRAQAVAGSTATPWPRATLSTQNPVVLRIQSVGLAFSNGTIPGAPGDPDIQTESGTNALIQQNIAPNSYRSHMPGGTNSNVSSAYLYFVSGGLGIENTFQFGTPNSVVDLFRVEPGSGPSTLVGSFRINRKGSLTFDPNPANFATATVNLTSATFSGPEGDCHIAIELERTGNTAVPLSVDILTTDGTATAGVDFPATPFTAHFKAGQATTTALFPINDRATFQGDRSFSVTIAPDEPGIAGTSNTATITIVEDDLLTSPQPGTYTGLASSVDSAPGFDDSGFVEITISTTLKLSGKVTIDGAKISFAGVVDSSGVVTPIGGGSTFLPLAIKNPGGAPPTPYGNIHLTVHGDEIVGMIKTTDNLTDIASVELSRAKYDGKTTFVPPALLAHDGYSTGVIPVRPQAGLTASDFPQGHGVMFLTVTDKGLVKVKGTLADGSKYGAIGRLSRTHAFTFGALMNKKADFFGGRMKFSDLEGSDCSGTGLVWTRAANPSAKHYQAGWSALIVDAFAANYSQTLFGTELPLLPVNPAGNATLTCTDGQLAAPFVAAVNITSTPLGATGLLVTNVPPTDKTYGVKLNVVKGTVSGFITDVTSSTKPKINGVVYLKGENRGAFGHFLTVPPTGVTPPPSGESGNFSLIPHE